MKVFSPLCKETAETMLIQMENILYKAIEFVPTNENLYKYCIFAIEEAKINLINNRYFSLKDKCRELLTDSTKYHIKIINLIDNIDFIMIQEYTSIIEDFINKKFSKKTEYNMKYDFIKNVLYYQDIRKEFVNYLMNNEKWEEPLIEIEGYNAQTLSKKVSIIKAYHFLVLLRKDPLETKNQLKELLL